MVAALAHEQYGRCLTQHLKRAARRDNGGGEVNA